MRRALCLLFPALLVAQSSLLRIRMVDSGAYTAGSRSPGIVVEVTDELGAPVPGAVVNVRFPDDGPSGSFASGLSSEIAKTGADGRATTSPVRWNALPGAVDIRVTAAKDRLHAGTVVTCRLSDGLPERHGPVVLVKPGASAAGGGHRLRWILIGAVAAGAAGIGLGLRGGGGGAQAGQPSAETGAVVIGAPTITVGSH
jgi:hypothetical protein